MELRLMGWTKVIRWNFRSVLLFKFIAQYPDFVLLVAFSGWFGSKYKI